MDPPADGSHPDLTPWGTKEDPIPSDRVTGRADQEPLESEPRLLRPDISSFDVGDRVGEDLSAFHR
jgi:hypothetical protein